MAPEQPQTKMKAQGLQCGCSTQKVGIQTIQYLLICTSFNYHTNENTRLITPTENISAELFGMTWV